MAPKKVRQTRSAKAPKKVQQTCSANAPKKVRPAGLGLKVRPEDLPEIQKPKLIEIGGMDRGQVSAMLGFLKYNADSNKCKKGSEHIEKHKMRSKPIKTWIRQQSKSFCRSLSNIAKT